MVEYTATNWVDGVTPVNAEHLNNLESGVSSVVNAVNVLEQVVDDGVSQIDGKQDKHDNELDTTDKTVVGAINELVDSVSSIETDVRDIESSKVDKVEGYGLSENDFTDTYKDKLDWIEAGAQVNTVSSVNERTGDVVLTKSDVGLGNVADTGDGDTPVENGTTKFTTGGAYTELNKKVDKVDGYALSQNNFSNFYRNKVDNIETGAQVNAVTSVNGKTGNVVIDVGASRLRKLKEVLLDSDSQQCDISEDSEGTPFNLSRVYVTIKLPGTIEGTSFSVGGYIYFDGSQTPWVYTILSGGRADAMGDFSAESVGDSLWIVKKDQFREESGVAYVDASHYEVPLFGNHGSITKVTVKRDDLVPAGTQIVVYGA